MRLLRALGLCTIFLALALSASALPMKPNVEQQLKDAAAPKFKYPVARVAWNGQDVARKPFNPVYEAMLYRISAQARMDELRELLVPAPGFLASIFGIIVLLRMMRRERERAADRRLAPVIVLPTPEPASEAA